MKKYTYRIFSLLLTVMFFSSCLKDDRMVLDPEKGHNVVEFANPGNRSGIGNLLTLYPLAVNVAPSIDMPFAISWSGPEASASQDINVTIALGEQAIVDDYNEEQHTDYEIMDASLFTISSTNLTIPKGQSKAPFTISVKSDQFDFSKNYVIPLKIVSSSHGDISGNFGTILVGVAPKNAYDGVFTVTGEMNDSQAAFTGLYPATFHLVTQSSNTVALFDPIYFGDYIHTMRNGSAVSGYGSFAPVFTFDENGNVTSVVNKHGQPASNGRSARIEPSGVNKWDASTRTLEVSYWLIQGGVDRTLFVEKWVYRGER